MRFMYYDDYGNPLTRDEWVKWFGDFEKNRKILYNTLPNGCYVSTVAMGLDRSSDGSLPLIFESLVSGPQGEVEMRRYSTRDEAIAGHVELVEKYTDESTP